MATYLSDTTQLDKLGYSTAERDRAQAAAAEDIDEAFRLAGYTTPVDTSTLTDADAKARLDAKLAATEQAIAVHILISADVTRDGDPTLQRKEFLRAMEWLKRVSAGTAGLSPQLAGRSRTFAIAGDRADTRPQDVLDVAEVPL